jgi:uncharacterized protein YkwD
MDHLTTRPRSDRRARSRVPLGLAIAAAALLAVSSPGVVLAWDNYSFSSSSENQMLTLINQARAARGLPALNDNNNLADVARWRSKDMWDRNYFDHNIPRPPGGKVFDELRRRGICYTVAGENIGVNNYPDDVATQTIFNGWMKSDGHRALILAKGFNRVGIGAFKGKGSDYPKHFWTAVFTHSCSSTPKATPKPTPKPTPKATPRPKPASPTPKPTPRPTPRATPAPTVGITPSPEDLLPTVGHDAIWLDWLPDDGFDNGIWSDWDGSGPPGPPGDPGPPARNEPGGPEPGAAGDTLQVLEPTSGLGLVDTIVGDVVASYFGK